MSALELSPPPVSDLSTGHPVVDRFFFLVENGVRGETQLRQEDWRDEVLALLHRTRQNVKVFAEADKVQAQMELSVGRERTASRQRLGSIAQCLRIARDVARCSESHDLLPPDWCQRRLADLSETLDRVQKEVCDLHMSLIPDRPSAATQQPTGPVRRESCGQDAMAIGPS